MFLSNPVLNGVAMFGFGHSDSDLSLPYCPRAAFGRNVCEYSVGRYFACCDGRVVPAALQDNPNARLFDPYDGVLHFHVHLFPFTSTSMLVFIKISSGGGPVGMFNYGRLRITLASLWRGAVLRWPPGPPPR